MTPSQTQTLKTDIQSKLQTVINGGGTIDAALSRTELQKIADYYNSQATPQVDLWRPDIPTTDLIKSIVMSEFILLTVQRQNGYLALTQGTFIDATSANIRNGFLAIFGAGATLTNLTAIAKKPATNFEALFVTGGVSTAYGVKVTQDDIREALRQ